MRNFEPKWLCSWAAYQNNKEPVSARGLALCTRHCPIGPFLILWIFRQAAHLRIASENLARNSDSTDLRSFWSGKNSFDNDLYDVITVNKSCLMSPWRRMIFLTVTFLSVNNTFIEYNIRYNEVLDSLTCFKCILRPFWIYANYVQNPRAEFGRICVW